MVEGSLDVAAEAQWILSFPRVGDTYSFNRNLRVSGSFHRRRTRSWVD